MVHTQLTSAVAEKAQRGVMELLLINHPLDCPMCDKGGECPLQNQAMSNGQGETRFTEDKRTFAKPVPISTQVLLDRERCISCTRCVRTSEEIAGDRVHRLHRARPQPVHRHRRGQAVQLLLLRQHRAGVPGRRADRRRVPVPVPAVRPDVGAERVRALRGRLPAAHRRQARPGDAAAGRRGAGRQRGVELRQGPVGVHLRDPAGPADRAAGQGRERGARPGVLAARAGGGRGRPAGGARRGSRGPGPRAAWAC